MARNDPNHPEFARAAQDVTAPHHREQEGPRHIGRGGAANIVKKNSPEPQRPSTAKSEDKGILGTAKELLSKIGVPVKK